MISRGKRQLRASGPQCPDLFLPGLLLLTILPFLSPGKTWPSWRGRAPGTEGKPSLGRDGLWALGEWAQSLSPESGPRLEFWEPSADRGDELGLRNSAHKKFLVILFKVCFSTLRNKNPFEKSLLYNTQTLLKYYAA